MLRRTYDFIAILSTYPIFINVNSITLIKKNPKSFVMNLWNSFRSPARVLWKLEMALRFQNLKIPGFHKSRSPSATGMQGPHGRLPKAGFVKSSMTAPWKGTGRGGNAISSKYIFGQTLFSSGQYPTTCARQELTIGQPLRVSFTNHKGWLAIYYRRGIWLENDLESLTQA